MPCGCPCPPAPGKVSVLAGHGLRGAVRLRPSSPPAAPTDPRDRPEQEKPTQLMLETGLGLGLATGRGGGAGGALPSPLLHFFIYVFHQHLSNTLLGPEEKDEVV